MSSPLTYTKQLPLPPIGPALHCSKCPMRELCLPAGMDEDGCSDVNGLVERRHLLQRGQSLYQVNEPTRDRLYVVRSGAVKSCLPVAGGGQRIAAFHGAGEMLGLDSIGNRLHHGSAEALESSVLCELSYPRLLQAARLAPQLERQFETLLGGALIRQQQTSLLLSQTHADRKLASFLLTCSNAGVPRGEPDAVLRLPMSRLEIGDYLGLTEATISRLLRQLQRAGCISQRQHQIAILAPAQLQAIADGQATPAAAA